MNSFGKILTWIGALPLLCFCSSLGERSVEIRSAPLSATVFTSSGEKLGETPLKIQGDKLGSLLQGNLLHVALRTPGYAEQQLIVEAHANDIYESKLTPLAENVFNEMMLSGFHKQINEFARSLLEIQGLVLAREVAKAENVLVNFQKKYPNIAASYLLFHNIERLRGNVDRARFMLLRGRSLDPDDTVIGRVLSSDFQNTEKEKH